MEPPPPRPRPPPPRRGWRGQGAGEDGAARSKVHGAARGRRGPARTSGEAPVCAWSARASRHWPASTHRSRLGIAVYYSTRGRLGIARCRCRGSQRVGFSSALGIGVERRMGRKERRMKRKRGDFSARCSGLLRPWRHYRAELKCLYLAARDAGLHRVCMPQKHLGSSLTAPVHVGGRVRVVGPLPA